jgi:hypothetical protein
VRLAVKKTGAGGNGWQKLTAEAEGARSFDCAGSLHTSDPASLGMTGFEISNGPVEKNGNSPLLAQSAREKWGTLRSTGGEVAGFSRACL